VKRITARRRLEPDPGIAPGEKTMTTRLTVLFVTTALLGFLVGARAVGVPTPVGSAASSAALREMDPLRGGFWRPAGSDAARPGVRLEPAAWAPAEASTPSAQPDTLAALRAIVRLATLE
jgi:hypothetical protein